MSALDELTLRALLDEAEYNEGEPCWCPLWWWDEQTGPTEGDHTDHCDSRRALFERISARERRPGTSDTAHG